MAGGQPVKLLDIKNPEFESKIEAWLDLVLLLESGATMRRNVDRLLKKRPREDSDVYMGRKDKFTYNNILGTALGWYGSAMFAENPEIFLTREGGKKSSDEKFYSNFLEDCNGCGTSFVDFFKRIFSCLLTYGAAWVLTDLAAIEPGEEAPQTFEEQKARKLLDPYLVMYTPINVINWECDARGALNWVVIKTTVQKQQFLMPPQIVDTWYYYDKEYYLVYEDVRKVGDVSIPTDGIGRTAKLLRSGKHALAKEKRVPVRRLLLSEGLWLANRAYLLLLDHLNQDNTLSWSLFMSNLAIPIIIGDVDASNMTSSENGYMQFPAGTDYKWSEPDGKSFQHSANRLESLREEAFRCMHLQSQGRSMSATPAMQSGRSKQLEMAPAVDILSGMGGDLKVHMQAVLSDVIAARQVEPLLPDVRGFHFEDDMSTEEVFAVSSVLGLRIPSKSFEKSLYKKVARSWMPDANRADLEKVYKEIDAGPTMDERNDQEFDKRVKLAKAGMEAALNKKLPGGQAQPPGRGGSGPSPRASE